MLKDFWQTKTMNIFFPKLLWSPCLSSVKRENVLASKLVPHIQLCWRLRKEREKTVHWGSSEWEVLCRSWASGTARSKWSECKRPVKQRKESMPRKTPIDRRPLAQSTISHYKETSKEQEHSQELRLDKVSLLKRNDLNQYKLWLKTIQPDSQDSFFC